MAAQDPPATKAGEELPLLSSSGKRPTDAAAAPSSTKHRQGSSAYVIIVSLCSAISGLCFGFEIGIIDTVLAMPSFRSYFGTYQYDVDGGETEDPSKDAVEGNIVSAFLVGAMLGSVLVSYIADRLGRRTSLIVGSAAFCAGALVQTFALGLPMLYAGRVGSGVAIGVLSMVAPLYVSESAPAHMRGRLVATVQLLITVGILLASAVNALMYSLASNETQWRGALGAQAVPGVALALLLTCMPESPRWLVSAGRYEEAATVLAKLRGSSSSSSEEVQEELEGMKAQLKAEVEAGAGVAGSKEEAGRDAESVEAEVLDKSGTVVLSRSGRRKAGGGWWRTAMWEPWQPLLSGPGLKRLGIACALQLFQQATGINVILYYGQRLFTELGVPREHAATSLVAANAALLVLGTLPGIALVDRPNVGRRKLLLAGAAAMAAFHACIGIAILCVGPLGDGETSPANVAAGWSAVACMLAFTVAFSATWGPCVWVVQSEIFPTHAERGKGGAVATLTNWTSNAVIGKVAPLVLTAIGPWTYVSFSVVCVVMGLFVYAVVPETGGRSLEDMGDILS